MTTTVTLPRQLGLRETAVLMLALLLVSAPHASRLPWWVSILAAMLAGWRLYLARMQFSLPRKPLLLLIVAGVTAGVYLHFRTIFGRDAGVALLIVMLALKLLETRSQRDAMLLIFLGYFLVITNFLYSQTIPTALYMLCCVWIITATMIGLHSRKPERGGYGPPLRLSGLLLLQSAPLMLVLFIFFPRVQGPLWGMPADAYSGLTGLSDTMTPGSLSNLILSDAVALRANFTSRVPLPNNLYWRGPVMWDFDGRTWTAPRFFYGGEPRYQTSGEPVNYAVTVEPHNKRWLFAIDLPARVPPQSAATHDFQLLTNRPLTARMRYDMVSYLEYSLGVDDGPMLLRRALQLPPGFNPRTLALARELRAKHTDDRALIKAVLERFRNENYSYTVTPPLLGTHSVDEFLFDTCSGFCEHYASAFAFLMRAAEIPTRIVTGYLGGEVNPVGGYLIVRQADAHAWTEVWLHDVGWMRIDPTAAVSPARVERGIAAAVPLTDPLPLSMRGDYPLLRQLRLTWDSMANSWNQLVLGYNPERQRQLMSRVGIDDATWRSLAFVLIITTTLICLLLLLLTLRRLRLRSADPVQLAYRKFCDKLKRRGLVRDHAEGPAAYARRVSAARPDLATAVAAISGLYIDLRYRESPTAEGIAELRRLTQAFAPT